MTLPLVLAILLVLSGAERLMSILRVSLVEAQEEDEESRPSLEDLREMREQMEGGSGRETISPATPSGGGESGGLSEELRGKLPQFEPTGPKGATGEAETVPGPSGRLFLQVQAPRELILGGTPPPACAGGRVGLNQAVLCVSGSSLDSSSQVQLRVVPTPHLRQLSYTPGNPAQAVYLFAARAPGTYTFTFEARLGNESATETAAIEVRQKEASPNNPPSLSVTRSSTWTVRVTAVDPDRGAGGQKERVCVSSANPKDLWDYRPACGFGEVSADYRVSGARVAAKPSCQTLALTFSATDNKATVYETIQIGVKPVVKYIVVPGIGMTWGIDRYEDC